MLNFLILIPRLEKKRRGISFYSHWYKSEAFAGCVWLKMCCDFINWLIFVKVNSSEQQQKEGNQRGVFATADKIIWKIIKKEFLKWAKAQSQQSQTVSGRVLRRINRRSNSWRWWRGFKEMPANSSVISGQIALFLSEPRASQNGSISKYNFSRYRWLELLSGWATRGSVEWQANTGDTLLDTSARMFLFFI